MKKKYLKTIEDIESLIPTDTKIYKDNNRGYYKFIRGVPCFFGHDSTVFYNATIDFDEVESMLYIEVEDEDDIGKLGWFSDADKKCKSYLSVLQMVRKSGDKVFMCSNGNVWKYFTPLTPEEVEKYTGYKVKEK